MQRIILILVLLLLLVLAGFGGVFWYFSSQLAPVSTKAGEAVTITIRKGESVEAIANDLKKAGLIRNVLVLKMFVWGESLSSKLQAGEYVLRPSMDVGEIVQMLSQNNTSKEVTIRFAEGSSNADIGDSLVKTSHLFSREAWDAAASVTDSRAILPDQSYPFLVDKPKTATLEGYLYPDTYRVFRDAKPEAVVAKMLENFGTKLTSDMIDAIHAQGKTVFEVVTLASIVEKEVSGDTNRKMVADVFLKRLQNGIALQSDVTVHYATGNHGALSLTDLQFDSPYNTYKYPGLPVGPISNPSISAMNAVIHPESNPYYYFLTTPSGEVVYGRTLAEHNANKARYLK